MTVSKKIRIPPIPTVALKRHNLTSIGRWLRREIRRQLLCAKWCPSRAAVYTYLVIGVVYVIIEIGQCWDSSWLAYCHLVGLLLYILNHGWECQAVIFQYVPDGVDVCGANHDIDGLTGMVGFSPKLNLLVRKINKTEPYFTVITECLFICLPLCCS